MEPSPRDRFPLPEREQDLLNVARAIRRYWIRQRQGLAGPNDGVFLARELERALSRYSDVPPVSDVDRRELMDRR